MRPKEQIRRQIALIGSLSVLLVMMSGLKGFSSEKVDFITLDRETYRFYQERKWDSLIDLGKKGLKQGFDYYYLRYRMGVAYFSMENYSQATLHFKKAYDFNHTESSLLDYLYYANLFLNRSQRATFYAEQLPAKKQNELLRHSRSFVQEAYMESGYVFSNDNEKNGRPESLWTDSSTYLENRLAGSRAYAHGGMKFRLNKRWSLYAGYSHLQAEKQKDYMFYSDLQLDSIVPVPGFESYYYSYQLESRSFKSTTRQNEVYLKSDFLIGKDWVISPYFHYLRVKYQQINVKYQPVEDSAIEYYDASQDRFNYFQYIRNEYSFNKKTSVLNDYLAGISLQRMFPNATVAINTAFSKLNFGKHINISATLSYFPFGNLDFYGSTSLGWFKTFDSPIQEDERILFSQLLGARLFSFLWIEGRFMGGGLQNTAWNNGFAVYNVPDELTYVAEGSFIFVLSQKLELTLRYQYWDKEGSATHYYLKDSEVPVNEEIITEYQNQMITGGLKWKF